jgi:class 3 adenylate cyclase/tetratricopeptide (TPR) repeat protein
MTDLERLDAAIAALQAQREVLGEEILRLALAPLLAQRAALDAAVQVRQVSVLFVDVADSTRLIGKVDPQDAVEILEGASRQFARRVEQHGGRVLRFAGDGLMAAFGAGEVREDDAERAVQAGLAIITDAAAHAERVRERFGLEGFAVRAGINTGPVMLSVGADTNATIIGHAVHLAARMEQSAPLGALRVNQSTWRHVAGRFEGDAQPPLMVKGSDEPLLTWIVRRRRPRIRQLRERGVEGMATPLLGRAAELAQLLECAKDAARARDLRALTIVADAGLGKSRLVSEFKALRSTRAADAAMLEGHAHPQSRLQPWGLLHDVLVRWLHIADDDSASVAKQRLVSGLLPYLSDGDDAGAQADAEAQAQIVGQLVGLEFKDSPHLQGVDGEQMRNRAMRAIAKVLGRMAARGDGTQVPCLVLEDLQWADDASLDFVEYLIGLYDALPLVLIMTARPDLREVRSRWGENGARHRVLTLGPLDAEDSAGLADALLERVDEAPEALRALLIERAEGNPFYMEEIVKMLLDNGAFVADGPRWRVQSERMAKLTIPGTLVGVLQARLDSLLASERDAIQQASIVGPIFWDEALAALDATAPQALPMLERKALVRPHETSAFEGAREETFHHHLLHQVTYDTVLKGVRRAGHAKVAQWLATRVGERATEYLAATAEHYARAGEYALAIDYYERAISEARDRGACGVVLDYTRRAMAMPGFNDLRRRYEILVDQGHCADLLGRRGLQKESLDERDRLADILDDDALRADSLASRAIFLDRQGDDRGAYDCAQRGLALAESIGAAEPAALCCAEMAWVHYSRGEIEEARGHLKTALDWVPRIAGERYRRNRRPAVFEIQFLTISSHIEEVANNWDAAIATAQRALDKAIAIHDRQTESMLHLMVGNFVNDLGDHERASESYEAARSAAHTIGHVGREADAMRALAKVSLARGNWAAALRQIDLAIATHERSGLQRAKAQCLLWRGRVLSATPGADAAVTIEALEKAIAAYESLRSEADVCVAQAFLADFLWRRGEFVPARALVSRVMMQVDRGLLLTAANYADVARLHLQRVLAADGDARAGPMLASLREDIKATLAGMADPAMRERFLDAAPWRREVLASQSS